MPHFLTIQQLSLGDVLLLMKHAKRWQKKVEKNACPSPFRNHFLTPLFFENSTRTRMSFEIAATRLGFSVLNMELGQSSLSKGETLEDTVLNLEALGSRAFVVRASQHETITNIASALHENSVVINAGSGCEHHPTQALLDFFTIQKHFKNWEKIKIAIVGDILHSRVAASFIALCQKLNIADVRLVSPKTFAPTHAPYPVFDNLKEGLAGVDVIMALRIQNERLAANENQGNTLQEYVKQYQINENTVKWAASHAIVMHPGPMNREVEINSAIADGPRSVILEQAQNGVFVRMAVLDFFAKTIL